MKRILSFWTSLPTSWKWGLLTLAWVLLVVVVLNHTPVEGEDQLRYLNVAWNMLRNHQYLATYVQEVNGYHLDLQKTPFMYWFIVAGWHLFGVNNAWPHMVTAAFAWVNLLLIYWLARQWYPDQPRIAWLAVLILLTSFMWPSFSVSIRFEHLVILFGLLYCNLMVKAVLEKNYWYTLLAGIALGFGLFAKGPVVIVSSLPFILATPFSLHISMRQVYPKVAISLLISFLIPLPWLGSLFIHYGYSPVHYLIFGQVHHRVSAKNLVAFHFNHSAWLLLWWLFILSFIPWSLLVNLWCNQKGWMAVFSRRGFAVTFSVLIVLIFFIFFVPMVTERYCVPACPFIALIFATILHSSWDQKLKPVLFYHFGIIFMAIGIFLLAIPYLNHFTQMYPLLLKTPLWMGSIILLMGSLFFFRWRSTGEYYLLLGATFYITQLIWQLTWEEAVNRPMSYDRMGAAVGELQYRNISVAQYCNNMCMIRVHPFNFLGRLQQPLPLFKEKERLYSWLKQNDKGWVVIESFHLLQCKEPFFNYQFSLNEDIEPYPMPHKRFSLKNGPKIDNLSLIDASNFKTCNISVSGR